MNKNYKKSVFYLSLPSAINSFISFFVMVPVTTYYLDPKDFGIFAILTAITNSLGPICTLGSRNLLSGNYFKVTEEEKKILIFNTIFVEFSFQSIITIVLWSISEEILPRIISSYTPTYLLYFKIVLIYFITSSLLGTYLYILILEKKTKLYAHIEIARGILKTIGTISSLVILNLGLLSLFIGMATSSVTIFIVQILLLSRQIRPKFDNGFIKKSIRLGYIMSPANTINSIQNFSDKYFIQHFSNLSSLGLYNHSLAYQRIFVNFGSAVGRSIIPESLKIFADKDNQHSLVNLLNEIVLLLTIGGLFIAFFSYDIVNILTHGKFIPAHYLMLPWYTMIFPGILWCADQQYLFTKNENAFISRMRTLIGIISIILVAAAAYYQNIYLVAAAIIISRTLLRLSIRLRSRKLKMDIPINEKSFYYSLIFLYSVYAIVIFSHLSLLLKIIFFSFLSIGTYILFSTTLKIRKVSLNKLLHKR